MKGLKDGQLVTARHPVEDGEYPVGNAISANAVYMTYAGGKVYHHELEITMRTYQEAMETNSEP